MSINKLVFYQKYNGSPIFINYIVFYQKYEMAPLSVSTK